MTDSTAQLTRSPDATRRTGDVRPEEIRGRSAGVNVGAVFGLVWAASTRAALSSAVWVPMLTVGVAISTVLMIGALRLRRAATGLPASAPDGPGRPTWRRHFTFVVAGEGVAIIAVVNIFAATGRSQWIPATICAAVGVHFAPLGRLFEVPLYYATALALCSVAAATLIAGVAGAPASLWTTLPGFGAALTLWATSTTLLVTSTALAHRATRRPVL